MYKWTNALYCINHEDNKSPHVTVTTVESHPAPGGRSRGLVKPPKYKKMSQYNTLTWPQNAIILISEDLNLFLNFPWEQPPPLCQHATGDRLQQSVCQAPFSKIQYLSQGPLVGKCISQLPTLQIPVSPCTKDITIDPLKTQTRIEVQ